MLASLTSSAAGAEIRGKVGISVDGFNLVSLKPGTVTEMQLTNAAGEQMRTFADSHGWFTLHDVAPGTYVLTTINPMFIYPELQLDVTAKAGLARAAYLVNKQQMMVQPFIIRPVALAQYYELRKPLDLWSFIKSPYGMMIGFMLFGIFVFPMLKVDPEEYKEAMAQLKGQAPADSGSSQQRIRDR
ncbi:hypothetical protein OEZ85_008157 [Tetradesmus obliquus]|uniref:ER membrane protein complex subunit 7 beta-sandwich domain-containing protein n=1 Tax=Tetradesmus obliquus TaxID=3088 RepID=A0ABY8TMN5_TETOB|nr:hypothetical protein OEZ85_008157 [Tetradesmus obliquus]